MISPSELIRFIINSDYRFLKLAELGKCDGLSDEEFIRRKWKAVTGTKLNLESPKTYNEKLQWLKLHDKSYDYAIMADKYKVKSYVAKIIGEDYIIPTLGVWENFQDIDFDILPNSFVLKTTHDSGGVIVVSDKTRFDIEAARRKLSSSLRRNYYYHGREWAYKNIHPRIIAEEYLVDESKYELKDYKLFAFNGKVKLIEVDFNRAVAHKCNIYTPDWKLVNGFIGYPPDFDKIIPRPQKLDEMILIAKKLSKGIAHVRVDMYSVYDKVYFGEMTFYHGSGLTVIKPESLNRKMGDWIDLSLVHCE